MTMKEQFEARHTEARLIAEVGDYVHNVPYQKYGIIIEELDPTVDAWGQLIERVFMVLYDNGTGMHMTGAGFLDLAVKAT